MKHNKNKNNVKGKHLRTVNITRNRLFIYERNVIVLHIRNGPTTYYLVPCNNNRSKT